MIELDVELARNSYLNSRILPIRTFSWRKSRTKPDINVIFILQPWISTDVTCENVIREIFIKREGSNMREGWHFTFLWIHQNLLDLAIFVTRSKSGAVFTIEPRGLGRSFVVDIFGTRTTQDNCASITRVPYASPNQGSMNRKVFLPGLRYPVWFADLTRSGPVRNLKTGLVRRIIARANPD